MNYCSHCCKRFTGDSCTCYVFFNSYDAKNAVTDSAKNAVTEIRKKAFRDAQEALEIKHCQEQIKYILYKDMSYETKRLLSKHGFTD